MSLPSNYLHIHLVVFNNDKRDFFGGVKVGVIFLYCEALKQNNDSLNSWSEHASKGLGFCWVGMLLLSGHRKFLINLRNLFPPSLSSCPPRRPLLSLSVPIGHF
ncbi:hypothetical protein C0J52_12667 [Blattella germanica]|nr:hypothetical protein C0J52_12667 [Blattella germanica]